MFRTVFMLLSGLGILLVGTGLLGTLLGLRAQQELFSNTAIGAIMTAYYFGYVVGTFIVPVMIRSVGHIRTFSALAAIASTAVVCHGLFIDPYIWFGLRFLSGIAILGIYMVVESWLNEQAAQAIRGQVFAIYMMVNLGCLALGQYLILAGDISTLNLFAIASMLFTLGLVPIASTRVHPPEPQINPPSKSLPMLLRMSRLATVGAFMSGIVNSAFWGLGAVFATRIGLSETDTAIYMSITIAGGAILQWPIGRWSDRHGRRGVLTLVSFIAAILAILLVFSTHLSTTFLFVNTFLYGGMMFSIYSLSVTYMNDRLTSPEEILEATRGLLLVYGAGAVTGPILGGVLMDNFGPGTAPGYSAIILLVLSATGLSRILYKKAIPIEEQGTFVPIVRTTPVMLEMNPQTEPELGETNEDTEVEDASTN